MLQTLRTTIPWLLGIPIVAGQQLQGDQAPYDLLGLSDSCFSVINTTVSSCPDWLRQHAGYTEPSVEVVPQEGLQALCETSCLSDLTQFRTEILGACNADTDVLVPDGGIAYPATFIVDRWLYAIGLSCLKDPSSGDYCDISVANWTSSDANYTADQECSYCGLAVQQKQLASPFGYTEQDAADFASLTLSCSQTTYAYATPTAYALNTTTTTPYTPTCTASHTVADGESCVSISGDYNVSTYGLINENALTVSCNELKEGRVLCLPEDCTIWQLDLLDTCDSIQADLNITMAQLLAWNPMINSGCSNLASWRGWHLCASPPGGSVAVGEGNSTSTTAAPVPTDAQAQSNTECATWYEVQEGDTCSILSLKFSISLADLIFLNPQIDTNCTNLWLDTSYCVKAVGDINTYSDYPSSTPAYVFPKPTTTATFTPVPVTLPTLNPHAPGTLEDCDFYDNPFDAGPNAGIDMAACETWADEAGVDLATFVQWNPSLSIGNCTMDLSYSYCISHEPEPAETFPYSYCFSANTTLIPESSAQPSECSCYIQFRAEDESLFSCDMFSSRFNTTTSAVSALNPWIKAGSDCESSVFSEITDGYVQLCVHSSSPTPPAETQPGAVSGCMKWHVVASGDGCAAIADEYGITLADFVAWNPGVGGDCASLWLGYAVCVGV
ncbi:LysM peptidoglycan-binding domain-containing protein [Aspergillus mulundensis]|uniref:LysM domain-containing protein n=1 Tax=Aspergillus mulundensis TaxID=1810919 RepID=A0A3D8SB51_9EURO|nr:hypothetical protein DSM5745_03923 [Aspergillus mulundensis]RDW83597.1 hypothetical protein DSM5745_03923 [Aspergillus mulundensis]